MQLNIYVPADRERILAELEAVSRRLRRPKNDLVLEALEQFLQRLRPPLRPYHLGAVREWKRADLYEERR